MHKSTWLKYGSAFFILMFFTQSYSQQQKADGTTITLNGGTASTTGDSTPAMWATNGGRIISNGANANTTGNASYGVEANLSGQVQLNGGTITTTNAMSAGLYAATQGSINAQGTQIYTTGAGAAGVVAQDFGKVMTNGGGITTSGQNAYGLLANSGGLISGGISISTSNTGASAVYAAGGQINYMGGNVSTQGDSSVGFQASNGGTLTATGFSLNTRGANAYGAYAQSGGSVTVTNGNIQTAGIGSVGGFADGVNSQVALSNLSLNTSNTNAYGLKAINSSTVSFAQGSLTTTGSSASVLMLSNGGTINLSGTSATAQGPNSYGLLVDNSSGSAASVLNISNGSLYSNQADAMYFDQGIAAVNGNQARISAQNGVLASAINGSIGNITGNNNSQYDGAVLTDASSSISMNLYNNSRWTGYAQQLTNLNIDSTSIWNMTASSIVSGTATNAGHIFFTPPAPNFKQLTFLGSYTGLDGNITLNTTVNGDYDSPTDLIVFLGPQASSSGRTGLAIRNMNGMGEPTNEGILIVNGTNGGTVGYQSFYLSAPVVAGPYEYLLVRDHSNNLYLRNSFPVQYTPPITLPAQVPDFVTPQPPQPSIPVVTLPTQAPPELVVPLPETPMPALPGGSLPLGGNEIPALANPTGSPLIPLYRQEVSSTTALASNIFTYDSLLLGNLHQRIGNTFYIDKANRRLWGRHINKKGASENNGTIYGEGPNYNFHIHTTQIGGDLYNTVWGRHHHILGIFGAKGDSRSTIQAPFVFIRGKDDISGPTFGGYFTYVHQEKFYLDGVLQGTRYRISADGGRFNPIRSRAHGISGSLETGYRYFLTNFFSLQPQTQLIVQSLSIHDAYDMTANVRFRNGTPMAGRLSLLGELNKSIAILDPFSVWLRGSYWRQGNRRNYTDYSSHSGYIPFASSLAKESLEGEVGLTAKIGRYVSIYGTYSRLHSLRKHGNMTTFIVGLSISR